MIPFRKVQGIGNDFVLFDGIANDLSDIRFELHAATICNRRLGVGADGILVLEQGSQAPIRMRIINSDGSTSEMCGNGIRCIAKTAIELGYAPGPKLECETPAGTLQLEVLPDQSVRVDMGPATVIGSLEVVAAGQTWRGTHVTTGNPHFVMFVDDTEAIDLNVVGPFLENHEQFPNRINVHFCTIVSLNQVVQRTWERGAGATLGCGTGACAVVAAGCSLGLLGREAEVKLPGGSLGIEISEPGHAIMSGPAEFVFSGYWKF